MSLDNNYTVHEAESASTTVSNSITPRGDGQDSHTAFQAELDVDTRETEIESDYDSDTTLVNSHLDSESLYGVETEAESDIDADFAVVSFLFDPETQGDLAEAYMAGLHSASEHISHLKHECTRLTQALEYSQQDTTRVTILLNQYLLDFQHSTSRAQPPPAPSPTEQKCDSCLAGDTKEIEYLHRVANRAVERADRAEAALATTTARANDAYLIIDNLRTENALADHRDIFQRRLLQSRERQINMLQDQLSKSAEEVKALGAANEASESSLQAVIDNKDIRIKLLEEELEIRKGKDKVRRVYAKDLLTRLKEEEAKNAAGPSSSDEPIVKRQRLD